MRRGRSLAVVRRAFAAAILSTSVPTFAQLAGGVAVESDFRFRGVSLSGEEPAIRASMSYDRKDGLYGGASATTVELDSARRRAMWLGYAGFARRTVVGRSWEAGATVAHFVGDARYDYVEAYAGVAGENWSARLFLSPDYFGRGARTAYAQLESAWMATASLSFFAHAGCLVQLNSRGQDEARSRFDTRLGATQRFGPLELQLSWITTGRSPYPAAYPQRRSTTVISASYAF